MRTKKTLTLFIILIACTVSDYACNMHVQKKQESDLLHTSANVNPCKEIKAVYALIEDAINTGAPIYNEGNPMGCFMIYEGTAYKILAKYGSKCKETKKILEAGLKSCNDYFYATDKAWVLRKAFDTILGVPTIKGKE
jgi:hypothetical protein